jgi:hypothetical protein
LQAAAAEYRLVFWFGEKLEANAEIASGASLQKMACARLLTVLPKQGKGDEVALLNHAIYRVGSQTELPAGIILTRAQIGPVDAPPPVLSNPGMIMQIAAETVVLSLVLSVASFLSFHFRNSNGANPVPLPRLVVGAPLVLFFAALVLLVNYLPFARIFEVYMASSSLANSVPAARLAELQRFTPLVNLQYPFMPWFRWNWFWLAIFGAPCIVFLLGMFSLVRLRVTAVIENRPASAN